MTTPIPAWVAFVTRGIAALGACVLVSATAVSVGCRACDGDVCTTRAWITIAEPDGRALRGGHYVLSLTQDGVAASAECEIGAGGGSAHCTALDDAQLSTPLFDSEDNPHEEIWLHFEDAPPETVMLRIVQDGVTVLDETVEFDYELTEPGCDADCVDASAALELTRP